MTTTISAEFDTRRDAETAVEHLVQEHGLDRGAIRVASADAQNTAGTRAAGSDLEEGGRKRGTEGEPPLNGRIRVSADVDKAEARKVVSSFETYGGSVST